MTNGGIIGVTNTPTTSVASGVWRLEEALNAVRQSIWPSADSILITYLVIAGGGGGGGTTSDAPGGGGLAVIEAV